MASQNDWRTSATPARKRKRPHTVTSATELSKTDEEVPSPAFTPLQEEHAATPMQPQDEGIETDVDVFPAAPSSAMHTKEHPEEIQDARELARQVRYCRAAVRRKLVLAHHGVLTPIVQQRGEYRTIYTNLRRTLLRRQSINLLCVGPSGCGKTLTVETVLTQLQQECTNASRSSSSNDPIVAVKTEGNAELSAARTTSLNLTQKPSFRVVRLNGLYQSDNAAALREIAAQLNQSGALQKTGANSDFRRNLSVILETARRDALAGASLIFVLEQFEAFAKGYDGGSGSSSGGSGANGRSEAGRVTSVPGEAGLHRQSMLYAVLDLVQDPTLSVAVVALSWRAAVTERLEKRLKSRFTTVQVSFQRPSLEAAAGTLTQLLTLSEEQAAASGVSLQHCNAWNAACAQLFAEDPREVAADSRAACKRRAAVVAAAAVAGSSSSSGGGSGGSNSSSSRAQQRQQQGESALSVLKRLLQCDTQYRGLCRLLEVAVARKVSAQSPYLTAAAVQYAAGQLEYDADLLAVQSLSELQLLVLVAVSRMERREKGAFTFQGVQQEYKTLGLRQASTLTHFSRDSLYHAFCSLLHQGLVRPRTAGAAAAAGGDFLHTPVCLCVRPERIADMVQQGAVECSTSVKQWCAQWVE